MKEYVLKAGSHDRQSGYVYCIVILLLFAESCYFDSVYPLPPLKDLYIGRCQIKPFTIHTL